MLHLTKRGRRLYAILRAVCALALMAGMWWLATEYYPVLALIVLVMSSALFAVIAWSFMAWLMEQHEPQPMPHHARGDNQSKTNNFCTEHRCRWFDNGPCPMSQPARMNWVQTQRERRTL